jgi:hypothetical protein
MGRPIRVPLNRAPDETWQLRLSMAPRSERIRYVEVEGSSLMVFPAHDWVDRADQVLDTVVHVINHANHTYFQTRRAREEAERQGAGSQGEDKLAGWWESRRGA